MESFVAKSPPPSDENRMRSSLLVLISAGLLLPPAAHAQERSTTLFLDAGPSFPVGDTYDLHSTGFAIGGAVEMPWTRSLAIRGDLNYNRFGLDDDEVLGRVGVPTGSDVELNGGEVSVLTALAVLVYRIPVSQDARLRPYLSAGLGYWRQALGDLTVRTSTGSETQRGTSDNGVAGALGAGLEVPFTEAMGFFVEGRYVVGWDFGDPPDVDDSHVPLRLGIAFTP